MTTCDYYSMASQIAQNLHQEGKTEWSAKLEEAIQFGSVGTETLMALRWHLKQFEARGETCTVETRQLIDELLRELNHGLK